MKHNVITFHNQKMDWGEDLFIFYYNLSSYYIFSLIVSFSAVLVTICLKYNHHEKSLLSIDSPVSGIQNENDKRKDEVDEDETTNAIDTIICKFKVARQQAIVDAVNLNEQQLEEEKRIESQQLSAIFSLLKEQKDKFQVETMEELENQLKLYR